MKIILIELTADNSPNRQNNRMTIGRSLKHRTGIKYESALVHDSLAGRRLVSLPVKSPPPEHSPILIAGAHIFTGWAPRF